MVTANKGDGSHITDMFSKKKKKKEKSKVRKTSVNFTYKILSSIKNKH